MIRPILRLLLEYELISGLRREPTHSRLSLDDQFGHGEYHRHDLRKNSRIS